jgi:hypothetical protein
MMTENRNDPPRLAIWLLKHACPVRENEALTGDVVERFCEGRSAAWVWKQALIATAIGIPTQIRRNWPLISYAIAGTAMLLVIPGNAMSKAQAIAHWWILPFPLSMWVWFLSPGALLAFAGLPALAVALLVKGSFRWSGLVRTWLFGLMLTTVLPFLVFLPSFNPHSVIWPAAPFTVFYTLVLSAWLGCRSPRDVISGKPAETRTI